MAKLKGHAKAVRQLRAMNSPSAKKRVEAALFAYGHMIEIEAQISISAGSVSGKNHVPSAPGEPPNFDTGHLAGAIETARVGDLEFEVSSNAEYSAALEFGTSKMAARPFMQPAAREMRGKGEELVAEAVRREIKKGFRS